jgi:hypothetical protein
MNVILNDEKNVFSRIAEESIADITIIRLPSKLFKEAVSARVRHFEKTGDNRISMGVSLF